MTIYPNKYEWYGEKEDDAYSDFIEKILIGTKGPTDPIGDFFLIDLGGIYLIQIILVVGSCLRIKFVEKLPKQFEDQSVGDREIWIPKQILANSSFVEKISKDKLRILKINSLENSETFNNSII